MSLFYLHIVGALVLVFWIRYLSRQVDYWKGESLDWKRLALDTGNRHVESMWMVNDVTTMLRRVTRRHVHGTQHNEMVKILMSLSEVLESIHVLSSSSGGGYAQWRSTHEKTVDVESEADPHSSAD